MKAWSGILSAFALYTIAVLVLFGDSSLFSGTAYLGTGGDPSLNIWMFQFLPQAIAHLKSLLVLKAAWAPIGLNITQATTTPLLAVLAWPITALAGPVVSFNIAMLASPVLAATSCFAFARTYTASWSTAFLAGWIFGFSTALFAAMCGHLQTAFIAFLPLAFLIVSQRAAGRLTLTKFLLSLVGVLIGQFLVSLETFVTEALFLSLFTITIETARSGGMRRLLQPHAENLILGVAASYAAVALVVSPFLFSFFHGYAAMPKALQNGGYFPIDLTNFVAPTPVTWLGGYGALPVTKHYIGNWSEDFGYIGAPLVIISIFAAWRVRRDRRAWPLHAVLLSAFIFTLGPQLRILGQPSLWMPWAAMGKLPLLDNVLPARMMVFVLLAISGLIAFWAGNLRRFRWLAQAAIIGGALVTLPATPVVPNWWDTPVPSAPLFDTGAYRNVIHRGDRVLFIPFSVLDGDVMFWQVETDGYYRMINGYGNLVPAWFGVWQAVAMLETGNPNQTFPLQFNLFTNAARIDEVVVSRSSLAVWDGPLEAAGWHQKIPGALTVFTKSGDSRQSFLLQETGS